MYAPRIMRAVHFASIAHKDQRRKGDGQEPYINHPIAVAAYVMCEEDEALIIAALLHDVVEDCGVSLDEIAHSFGGEVAAIVNEVTDDKSLPQNVRKELQVQHGGRLSYKAQLIKAGDKIDNLKSLIYDPPVDWDDDRKAEYADWGKRVVDNCVLVGPGFKADYDELYHILMSRLGRE